MPAPVEKSHAKPHYSVLGRISPSYRSSTLPPERSLFFCSQGFDGSESSELGSGLRKSRALLLAFFEI